MNFKIEPQIKAPRVTPLEGVSTYGCAIRVVWESRTARFRHDKRRFAKNEDAVSITLGFILIFFITILFFSAIIISFYTLSRQSQQIATMQSFDILGSGIALKISSTDGLINVTKYYGGTVNTLEYGFSIPASMANDDYSINITNGTNRVIILEADNGAKAWIPYNTSIMLEEKLFFSGIGDYKLTYNGTSNQIIIKEQ